MKEFIEHIQNTTQPQIVEKDGATFIVYAEEAPHQLQPTIDHPDTLPLHSLDALVKLVRTEASKAETPLYITIPDHLTVRCFGQPQPDAWPFRQVYYEAKATDVPGFRDGFREYEKAIIELRTAPADRQRKRKDGNKNVIRRDTVCSII